MLTDDGSADSTVVSNILLFNSEILTRITLLTSQMLQEDADDELCDGLVAAIIGASQRLVSEANNNDGKNWLHHALLKDSKTGAVATVTVFVSTDPAIFEASKRDVESGGD